MNTLMMLAVSSIAWGAVLCVVGLILQRNSNVSGRTRQWIWRGATMLLLAPWIASPVVSALGLGLAPAEVVATHVSEQPTAEFVSAAVAAEPATVEAAIVENGGGILAWLGGLNWAELAVVALIIGWVVRWVAAQLAFRSLLGIINNSRVAEPGPATIALACWSQRLGLRRTPRLRIVEASVSPFSCGVFRPVIYLPEGIEDQLSTEALDLVVGHETLHIARGDGWRRPLERITADVFWFNPFAWLVRRELDVARELACDEGVVELSSARHAYARTLRDVAEFSAGLSHALPAASMSLAGGRSLVLRVTRTLALAKRKPARSAVIAACALGLIGAPIAVAQVMLATPAPPPPPAVPAPPAPPAPEAIAALEAPEAPPAPEALETPEAPQPPVAEQQVYVSPDGLVRASFSAKVTSTTGSAAQGFSVSLEGTDRNSDGNGCVAELDGLGGLSVAKDQTVARGAPIGKRGNGGSLSFTVHCSDEFDANGKPVFYAPPAPPAPVAPVEAVAPVAPLAPVSPPSPVAAPAPLAPIAPLAAPKPAPMAAPVPPVPVKPPNGWDQPPPAPLVVPPTPFTPKTPVTPTQESKQQKTKILAPFGARVLTVEPGVAGATIVKLQEQSGKPIKPGDTVCLAIYETVTSANVVAGQQIAKGEFVGMAPVEVVANGVKCGTAKAFDKSLTVKQGQNFGKADFRLSGDTSAVLAQPGEISSRFGYMTDPFNGQQAFHVGVDVKGAAGLAVHAPAAGTVTFAGDKGPNGRVVELDLDDGVTMKFAHLDDISVAVGEAVKAGATIGTVGNTGRSTGSHVHVEVYRNGKAYDPESVGNLTLSTR